MIRKKKNKNSEEAKPKKKSNIIQVFRPQNASTPEGKNYGKNRSGGKSGSGSARPSRDPDHRIRVSRIRVRVRDSRPDRASSVRLRAVPVREGLNRTVRVPVRASGMLPEEALRASSVRVKTAAREDQARAVREEQARAVREDRAREDQVRAVREDRARVDQVRVVREDRAREVMTAADRRATRTEEISAEVLRTGAALQLQRKPQGESGDTPLVQKPSRDVRKDKDKEKDKVTQRGDKFGNDRQKGASKRPNQGRRQQSRIPKALQKPVHQQPKEEKKEVIKEIILPEKMTIRELADKMKMQPSVIVKKLFMRGLW